MGCSSCAAAAAARSNKINVQQQKKEVVPPEDCEFTMDQISAWIDKVNCVKSQSLHLVIPNITKKQVNAYLSTLLSAKNYVENPCHFQNELEEVESFITVLIALNLCNN